MVYLFEIREDSTLANKIKSKWKIKIRKWKIHVIEGGRIWYQVKIPPLGLSLVNLCYDWLWYWLDMFIKITGNTIHSSNWCESFGFYSNQSFIWNVSCFHKRVSDACVIVCTRELKQLPQLPFCFPNPFLLSEVLASISVTWDYRGSAQSSAARFDDIHTNIPTHSHTLSSSRSFSLWLFWPKPYSQC